MKEFYIVYTGLNNRQITVKELTFSEAINEDVAMSKTFADKDIAILTAKGLAQEYAIDYVGNSSSTEMINVSDSLESCQREIKEILNKYDCHIIAADEYTSTLIRSNVNYETVSI